MNIGMLWFDNDRKAELSAKVERAVSYYRNKYGISPTLCFVHPTMLPNTGTPKPVGEVKIEEKEEKIFRAAGVEIRSNRSVLPNHLWIGVNGVLDPQSTGV